MAVIDELVCPARGSFSLSTKVLSVHVTGNQLSEKVKPFPSTMFFRLRNAKTIIVFWILLLSKA